MTCEHPRWYGSPAIVTVRSALSSGRLQCVHLLAAIPASAAGTVQSAIVERAHVAHVTGNTRNPGTVDMISTTRRPSSRLSSSARARQPLHNRP